MTNSLRFIQFLDGFLPTSMRNDPLLEWDDRVRAWGMIAVIIISLLIPIASILIFVFLQLTTGLDFSNTFFILLSVIFLIFVQHLYFQSYGKLSIVANAYAVQAFISYCLTIYYTGGWQSPLMFLLLCSPIISFMTGGFLAGVVSTEGVFLAILMFYMFRDATAGMTSIIQAGSEGIIVLVVWMVVLTFLLLFLFMINALIYEHEISEEFFVQNTGLYQA